MPEGSDQYQTSAAIIVSGTANPPIQQTMHFGSSTAVLSYAELAMNKTASGSKSDASSSAALARSAAATMALIVASSVMLSWVAFYNRAPLVFPDTVAYATAALEREV